ncbi:MAG: hypothetical protein J4N76_11780 [Chloroflexi bacterium]|nr:hypothetical protein [Chloroflexota bacterium]MCH8877941.1 hypothetical protein [Chloroflexota bacterium]MCI0877224.1 hypothetical protein [Chloroflexota bacterium]MCI0893247.1 hypothetical protein [Chloroflexota bacterium]
MTNIQELFPGPERQDGLPDPVQAQQFPHLTDLRVLRVPDLLHPLPFQLLDLPTH